MYEGEAKMKEDILYKDYLKKLKRDEIVTIIKDYNSFSTIDSTITPIEIKNVKKDKLIKLLLENLKNYYKNIIMCMDLCDYNKLKNIIDHITNDTPCEQKFIKYLASKKILIDKENLVIANDCKDILIDLLNDGDIYNSILENVNVYRLSEGIINAYGSISVELFDELTSNKSSLVEKYYKKEYKMDSEKIYSSELPNDKATKLLKNKDLKKFTKDELYQLGTCTYHHNFKAYKKLIKLIKEYYIFKKEDLRFIDDYILVPYLYVPSTKKNKELLDNNIVENFEIKEDKLKDKMIELINELKDELPNWSKRGYSEKEAKRA